MILVRFSPEPGPEVAIQYGGAAVVQARCNDSLYRDGLFSSQYTG